MATTEMSEAIARELTGIGVGTFNEAAAHIGGLLQEVARAINGLHPEDYEKCYVTQRPKDDLGPRPWRWHAKRELSRVKVIYPDLKDLPDDEAWLEYLHQVDRDEVKELEAAKVQT